MKTISTEIRIKATASQVWHALMDFDAYPRWNPFIRITGEAQVGEQLVNTIRMESGKSQVFKPVVREVVPNRKFRWIGHLFFKGLFDGEHYFEIQEMENGHLRFVHGENFRGILSGLLMKMIGAQTEAGFVQMNTALKSYVESQNS